MAGEKIWLGGLNMELGRWVMMWLGDDSGNDGGWTIVRMMVGMMVVGRW